MEAVMDSLKRQLNMIAECLPPSPFKASVEQVAANAIAELDRLTTENAALTAENTRIFAMIDAREQAIAELTALCDEYRGEVDPLKDIITSLEAQLEESRAEVERLQSALTRARAEALEEAAVIVASWSWAEVALVGHPALRKIAATIRARAAKGEQ